MENPKEEPKQFEDEFGFQSRIINKVWNEEKPKQETLEDIKLEEVFGSEYCQFSVIENKLAILYRNQEQILKAIKLLSNENKETLEELISNSDEDMIEFVNWAFKDENPFIKYSDKWIQACGNSTSWTTKELLQLWKEQKTKTLYYE